MKDLRINRFSGAMFALLLLNSAYLAALPSATTFYVGNMLLHLGLGAAVLVFALKSVRAYPRESGAMVAAGIVGLYLAVAGNTLDHRWMLWLHIAFGVAAAALIIARLPRKPALAVLLALVVAGVSYRYFLPRPGNRIV